MKLGADFNFHERVTGLITNGNKRNLSIKGVNTTKGEYKADAIVNAVSYTHLTLPTN